jgi:hypothetical protein
MARRDIETNPRVLATAFAKLVSGSQPLKPLTDSERSALAYVVRREIETNRYPQAPQLGPLGSAFAKLCPGEEPPKSPGTPRRRTRR